MKPMKLRDLFIQKVQALYDIEQMLIKALPKMAKAANHEELKKGFQDHLSETQNQAKRLEDIFDLLGEKPKKLKVDGIRGIIKDGEWVIKNVKPNEARDANLARAAQYAEHYEMAGYMGAITWAEELEEKEIVALLKETLQEEKAADEKLNWVGMKIDKGLI